MLNDDIQLMLRRRWHDGFDDMWLGYDEILNGQNTGRIIMGWTIDPVTLKITHQYADTPPELNPATARKLRLNDHLLSVQPAPVVAPAAPVANPQPAVTHTSTSSPQTTIETVVMTTVRTITQVPQPFVVVEPTSVVTEDVSQEPTPNTSQLTGAVERLILTFTWAYGDERVVLEALEDAVPQRKAIENKFGHLKPTGWAIIREWVVTEDVPWVG
jgi:hypothetical protein